MFSLILVFGLQVLSGHRVTRDHELLFPNINGVLKLYIY